MAMDLANNRTEWRDHLRRMVSMEKQSGEYLLASVVQDSLTYNLNHHAQSETLLQVAHVAAEVAVETAVVEMMANSFAVCEAIRGVMHTMVSLGGEPVLVAVAITTGGLAGLECAPQSDTPDSEALTAAIVRGLVLAAADLGLQQGDVEMVANHIVGHVEAIPFSRDTPANASSAS